ncbi:MAG TPA: hypothetical protein VLA17_17420, partial [Candidatus Limnocylindria bacterium]|nr:hypothetical protein [Candidatus Limnocylindria bacterium]
MSSTQPNKKPTRRTLAATEAAGQPVGTQFEAWTTAAILSLYAALLAHPIDLTIGDLGRHLKNGEMVVRSGVVA